VGWLPSTPPFVSRDAALVCAAGTLRAAAVSLAGVLIAIHLAGAGLSPAAIGLVIGCGVAGNTIGTIVTGLWADAWGRKRTLVALCVLSSAGYAGVAVTDLREQHDERRPERGMGRWTVVGRHRDAASRAVGSAIHRWDAENRLRCRFVSIVPSPAPA
jgi:sugar transport protein